MITDWPQPRCAHSSAARITSTLPMHSNEWSTPQPVISTTTCWIGLSWSFGLTQSVAPIARARSNLAGLVSMAMIRPALACTARSEEHTSELQSLMRISYAVFCLKKKTQNNTKTIQQTKNQHNTYRD